MSGLALIELVTATEAEVLLEFCVSDGMAPQHFSLLLLRHPLLLGLSAVLFGFQLLELAKVSLALALLLLADLLHLSGLDGGESGRFLSVGLGTSCFFRCLLLFDLGESFLLLALLSFLRLTNGDLLATSDGVKSELRYWDLFLADGTKLGGLGLCVSSLHNK